MFYDAKNPLSVAYARYALKTWEPTRDFFDIELVQCITPDNPLYQQSLHLFSKHKDRSPAEICIYLSYFMLWNEMIRNNEPFWTLEHDACFKKNSLPFFKRILENIDDYKCILPGGSVEMVWMDMPTVRKVVKFFQTQEKKLTYNFSGPMGLLFFATGELTDKKVIGPVYGPKYNYMQLIHYSDSLKNGESQHNNDHVDYWTPSIVNHVYCVEEGNTRGDYSSVITPTKLAQLQHSAVLVTPEELKINEIKLELQNNLK